MRFFVAKVNVRNSRALGYAFLRPLQVVRVAEVHVADPALAP